MKMFDEAGGVDKVNQEAKILFERFGTNETMEIYGPSLTNFPALSTLGRPLFLKNQNKPPGWSTHIDIPFGSQSQRNFIFIFDPRTAIEFPYASRCVELRTNIFVGK